MKKPTDLGEHRRRKKRAKVQATLDEIRDVMASDPGFQEAARKRRLEREFAERVAGPQRFSVGDRVVYAGEDEAIPKEWVGVVVEHVWTNEDRLIPGTREVEERPYHSYVVDWRDLRGEVHNDFRDQDSLALVPGRTPGRTGRGFRRNPKMDTKEIETRFKVLVTSANRRHGAFTRPVRLVVDEETALQGRDPEGRGHAAADESTVYIAPKLIDCPGLSAVARRDRQTGVLAHELGHVALFQRGETDHSERDADVEAERLFGYIIRYDKDEVQTIGPGHTRPSWL